MTTIASEESIWLEALDLEERLALMQSRGSFTQPSADARTTWRVSKWRDTFGKATSHLEKALHAAGMSVEEFEAAIALDVSTLQRVDREPPKLAGKLEAICHQWPTRTDKSSHVRGFVMRGRDRLRDAIGLDGTSRQRIADRVWSQLDDELTRALSMLCLKTFVLEMNASRVLGTLIGDTPQERYQHFIDSIDTPAGAKRFYSRYPVLARRLTVASEAWADALADCIGRVCRDQRTLDEVFGGGDTLGPLTSISGAAGDLHANHRAVRVLTFESGVSVVYKPRPIDIDRHFQELLCWLNERGWNPAFRARQSLPRGDYGWSEYVRKGDCSDPQMVHRFYERHGGLLAVMFLLAGNDCHSENVVAAGEHPFLIDVETLFRAPFTTTTARSNIGSVESRTVIGVGLLPQLQLATSESPGVDLSGIGGRGGQNIRWPSEMISLSGTDEMRVSKDHGVLREFENRPTLDGTPVDPYAFDNDVVAGFLRMYDLVMNYRNELTGSDGPLLRFTHDAVRVILRPTRLYGSLLADALHPDVVQSGLDQDRLFDSLWKVSEHLPCVASIVRAEQRDLRNGDIPLFTGRVESNEHLNERRRSYRRRASVFWPGRCCW